MWQSWPLLNLSVWHSQCVGFAHWLRAASSLAGWSHLRKTSLPRVPHWETYRWKRACGTVCIGVRGDGVEAALSLNPRLVSGPLYLGERGSTPYVLKFLLYQLYCATLSSWQNEEQKKREARFELSLSTRILKPPPTWVQLHPWLLTLTLTPATHTSTSPNHGVGKTVV